MSAQPSVLQVVILRDGLLVGTEVVVPGQYTLGSAPESELRLDDGMVAAQHATLYFQNGRAAIQDLKSPSGVWVNGQRVNACEVRSVDEVMIGPFALKMRVLAQKPAAKPGPPPEVAALLGGAPPAPAPVARVAAAPAAPAAPAPAPARPPPAATVVSSRRMAAAPAQAQPPPPAAAPAPIPAVTVPVNNARPQLRAVSSSPYAADQEDETRTESVMVGELADALPTARAPAMNVRPPPPPPPSMPTPGHFAPTDPEMAAAVARPAPAPVSKAPSARALPPVQAKAPSQRALPPMDPLRADTKPVPTQPQPGRAHRSVPSIPMAGEGKGKPRLFFELYWGETRQAARSFGVIPAKKPVMAAPDDKAGMPLWGFEDPKPIVLADQRGASYRVFVPVGAAVEKRGDDGNFYPLTLDQLDAIGQRKFVSLGNGTAVRFTNDGDISLVAYVQPPLPRPFVNPLLGLPWLSIFLFVLIAGAAGAFLSLVPSNELPDFSDKKLPPVAVRLVAPEPKKKEEAKKKLEEIKKKEPKKPEPVVAKTEKPLKVPPPPAAPPETTKALKSLEKLSAAGPAMKDLLAAVDKLGNGPGKKDAKNDFKLTGLIGKQPIANAGLGNFGLGGGGQGGFGTKGLEVLRGKGGGGIGALGAGNVGKGAVGGAVTRATARNVGAQGTIDREAVAKVINSHLAEVSACYERALLKEPGLAGKIVLEWNISTSGTVTTAKTKSSTMKSSAVEGCILNSLKTWKFPPAKGAGVVISYPFLFNSVGF